MNLVLRPYRENEFTRACEIRNLNGDKSRENFKKFFVESGSWSDHYLHLAIDLDGELVGDIQLRKCSFTIPPGTWDMGIELAPEKRGKGVGRQCLKLVSDYAFNHGAHRIQGSTDESNMAMRKAFEGAGWKFEGVFKALFVVEGVPCDYYSFAKTKFD